MRKKKMGPCFFLFFYCCCFCLFFCLRETHPFFSVDVFVLFCLFGLLVHVYFICLICLLLLYLFCTKIWYFSWIWLYLMLIFIDWLMIGVAQMHIERRQEKNVFFLFGIDSNPVLCVIVFWFTFWIKWLSCEAFDN